TGTATGSLGTDLNSLLHVAATTYTNVPGGLVHWTFDGDANYNPAAGDATVTITKVDATIHVTAYHVTYDTNPHTATGTATGVGGVDLSGGLHLGGTTHTNAGTYNGDAWTFSGGTNYNDANGTVDDLIDKATPTATLAVTNSPQTYNGSPKSATVGINASSVPGSVANVLTGGAATQTTAGTYAVTADFVPTDSTNYNTLPGLSA